MTNEVTSVTEISHAKYGASGWSGWGFCPTWEGGGAASIYAATGSVIHEVSAECLTTGKEPEQFIDRQYESDGFTIRFNADHAAIARKYVDTCRDLHKSLGGSMLVEQTLPIDHLTGEEGAVSTTDFGIIPPPGQTEMIVLDLKTGAGVPVSAEDNGQLAIYALAMLDEYGMVADIDTVRMIIVQPPLNNVSEWVQTVTQLAAFRDEVKLAAARAMSPAAESVPGDKQCRWCTKKSTCPAIAAQVNDIFEAVDPADTSVDELADAMAKVDLMEGWIKAIRAEVERRLLDGRTVKGYKLVQGKRGNRQWSDKAEAEKLLKAMRLTKDEIYDAVLISPTSADKLAQAGVIGARQWPKVQALITQSDGKPSVAPVSDKRPALDINAETFTNLSTEVPE